MLIIYLKFGTRREIRFYSIDGFKVKRLNTTFKFPITSISQPKMMYNLGYDPVTNKYLILLNCINHDLEEKTLEEQMKLSNVTYDCDGLTIFYLNF